MGRIMARKIIDTGVVGNDGTGDSIRDSFRKVNDNFRELYSSLGLGDRLSFRGLEDTPDDYTGFENAFVLLNSDASKLVFKNLLPGSGITFDSSVDNQISISSAFQTISADPNPQLGGDLSAVSGGVQYRIKDLVTPVSGNEAANKSYTDTKISLAGVEAVDPETGQRNTSFGQMSGPLILSRDPETDDDEVFGGLIAATKRYVDTSAFGSSINLYVATSGQDDRTNISTDIQGRALAYAFRTIEGALKRAEELILESRIELGPYKKVLTYNNGQGPCVLDQITIVPNSGSGFSGQVYMSVDSVKISSPGVNYTVGDVITVFDGVFDQPASFEVLATVSSPLGGIATLRPITSGVYLALPGNLNVSTITNSSIGNGATLDLTYKVNRVDVVDGGSDYGLVSVRIAGGGGSGAFGFADVVNESVQSITITDQGSGFISLPNVIVNFPRFLIDTKGFRTDFTGDVINTTKDAASTRDLREGLFLRGETSGALAQILTHDGSLVGDNEIFDVDVQYGNFIEGEVISYGNATKLTQITVLVESGTYEENLPLKVSQNVSIVGNEFRRVIVRPKPGNSSSSWASILYRRDTVIDSLDIVNNEYGYHYLTDSTRPVYPIINNRGRYRAAAELIALNRKFIQKEIIAWVNYQKINDIFPFTPSFSYNAVQYEKNIGLLIDSVVFDLKWGGSNRTVADGLKYFDLDSSRLDLSLELTEFTAIIEEVEQFLQLIIKNQEVVDLKQNAFTQIIDRAYVAEVGSGFAEFSIVNATATNPIVITTEEFHGLTNGDSVAISDVVGMVELNDNLYYIGLISVNSFELYTDPGLTDTVDGVGFAGYIEGGAGVNQGGVVRALIKSFNDVLSEDLSVNKPIDSTTMDMFLCNDSVRFQAVTMQGQGGFAMVLDPTGQILSKSPYAQECSSFSRSTGRKTFAGGMLIDGFSGNLKFKILGKLTVNADQIRINRSYTIKTVGTTDFTQIGALSNTQGDVFIATDTTTGTGTVEDNSFLRVGELQRLPQLPASFIVDDVVYRINYVRDFKFNVEGSTASFVLDETTPWVFDLIEYDEVIYERDIGLVLTGLSYDLVFESNYHSRKSGLLYRQANAKKVIDSQLSITVRGIDKAHALAESVVVTSETAVGIVKSSNAEIEKIISNGAVFASGLVIPGPLGLNLDISKAKNQLLNNTDFIIAETVAWIDYQIVNNLSPFTTSFAYDFVKYSNFIRFAVEAVAYDITYGGNSQVRDSAINYYRGAGDLIELQLSAGEVTQYVAAFNYSRYLCKQVVQDLAPDGFYSLLSRVPGDASTLAVANDIDLRLSIIPSAIVDGVGTAPSEILPDLDAYSYDATLKTASSTLVTEIPEIQSDTLLFVSIIVNQYEVLTPGNRSMLGNDFTQINDLGYGVVATNGGLSEVVSVFTYYNQISYYSLNGGQIRSVSGSSANGVFALVAEGSDPLEKPAPVSLFHELSQGAKCYFPSSSFANVQGDIVIFVTDYSYVPLSNSELEVDHGLGSVFKYPINSVSTDSMPAGVARLSLGASEGFGTRGLAAVVSDQTKLTIRMSSDLVLTGSVVGISTRPSTGLVLNEPKREEDEPTIYRVLQFSEYEDSAGSKTVTINVSDPATVSRTNHELRPDYQISFSTTGALPTGIVIDQPYYVLPEGFTPNSFRISLIKRGNPIATSGTQSGTHSYVVAGLAVATLIENYNYVSLNVWAAQPFASLERTCTLTIAVPGVVNLVGHGFAPNTAIKFTTDTVDGLPTGILDIRHYWVATVVGPDSFTITDVFGGAAIAFSGTQSGNHSVGDVVGRAGDSEFAVVGVGEDKELRLVGFKFVWLGEEYIVADYKNENITGEDYSLLTLNRPLVDSVINYTGLPTLKVGSLKDQAGALTVRISLTRVTGHDLLDIGTGSYADTNYPNEIFGPSVNPINQDGETDERSLGRVFSATTDQFGNFRVGSLFSVDQGTGSVKFAAAIVLTKIDGLGFKRGVEISEFSSDSSMSRSAPDAVPTENAIRRYIERRLGLNHEGNAVITPDRLIPPDTGGYLSLDGQLAMKSNLNVGDNKIINLSDPTGPQDAVNLQSLTFVNFQNTNVTSPAAGDLLAFTGTGNNAENYSVVGDITSSIGSSPGSLNFQITAGSIVNNDINASAAIIQSKLSLNPATTRANAAGITQADRGLVSFDSSQFDTTAGWATIKNNGLATGKLQQIPGGHVLGNNSLTTSNVTSFGFSTVVDQGGAVKKSQYSSGTGFLRRSSSSFNSDADYSIVDESTNNVGNTLVKRNSFGDFSARNVNVSRLIVDDITTLDTTTSSTGGYTVLYGFQGQSALLIGDGSQTTDKITLYNNDRHRFRNRNDTADAPVSTGALTAASVVTTAVTTGAVNTAGTLTGNWSLTTTSNLTVGTGVIDARTGTLQSRTLTTGNSSTTGTVTGNWSLTSGSRLEATYADLAEYYEGDKNYEVGTVLVFGGDKEVTLSSRANDYRVAGVVSDNAAYVMNAECPGLKVCIALQGRVKCRVVGNIEKGDLMITSNIAGVAISAKGQAMAGTIIGKSLENYKSDHIGTIEVAVGRT